MRRDWSFSMLLNCVSKQKKIQSHLLDDKCNVRVRHPPGQETELETMTVHDMVTSPLCNEGLLYLWYSANFLYESNLMKKNHIM